MSKILVIDDDRSFRQFLVTLLERDGYEVRALSNGLGVEQVLASEPFAAVVTDLYMPGADGIETIRKVKKQAPSLPVIGLTGEHLIENDPYQRAMRAFGADAVMIKPLNTTVFLEVLRRVLSRDGSGETALGPPGADQLRETPT